MSQGWKALSEGHAARLVFTSCLANMMTGMFIQSYGVFFKPLAAEFGSSRTQVSIGAIIFLMVVSLSSPFIGMAVDRLPIRRVMIAGVLAAGSGMMLLSLAQTQWQFYLIVGLLVAMSAQAMGACSTTKLMTNWFRVNRGLALGIVGIGMSFSGIIFPPLGAWLIGLVGWRQAYLIAGATLMLVLIPLIALFVFNRRQDAGANAEPGSEDAESSPAAAIDARPWTVPELLRNASFWNITLICGLPIGIMAAFHVNVVPHASDRGLSAIDAASVLSAAAALGAVGKVGWGWLIDRFSPRLVIWAAFSFIASGILVVIGSHNYWNLILGAALFGLGAGCTMPIHAVLLSRSFGRESFGRAFGLGVLMSLPLTVSTMYLTGRLHDHFKDYGPSFQLYLGLLAIAALAAVWLKDTRPAKSVGAGNPGGVAFKRNA